MKMSTSIYKANNKIEVEAVKDGSGDTCCTFVIHDEDHTLGNSLRYIISKNPDVEFCGYCIPHPAENKINLRIQTKGESASNVLKKGLEDLHTVCEHMLNTFDKSINEFKNNERNNEHE